MRLYLVQHGEARPEAEDPARPLTEKGRQDVERVARFAIAHADARPRRIVHSGRLRARQTAEVWARFLPEARLEEQDGLGPNDDPAVWAKRLGDETEDLLLVGHLPHLRRLAALLLCGDPDREGIAFRMAGVVCLERDERTGGWTLRWSVPPDLVP